MTTSAPPGLRGLGSDRLSLVQVWCLKHHFQESTQLCQAQSYVFCPHSSPVTQLLSRPFLDEETDSERVVSCRRLHSQEAEMPEFVHRSLDPEATHCEASSSSPNPPMAGSCYSPARPEADAARSLQFAAA
jgi:hypothetical protein